MEQITFELPVRKRNSWKFLFFILITGGYYLYFWMWKLVNDVNDLEMVKSKKINYWCFAAPLMILDVFDIRNTILTWESDVLFTPWDKFYLRMYGLLFFVLSIFVLSKLDEYALEKYNVKIRHSLIFMLFSPLYINFALNNFNDRVNKFIKKSETNKC